MKKKLKYIILYLFIATGLILFFAPVSKEGGLYQVATTIDINQNIDTVFKYMGNSQSAAIWSVYVDHITLIEGVDGQIGCTRRCFQNEDETGIRWDEDIIQVKVNQLRELSIYNANDFPIYVENLRTFQIYNPLNGSMRLGLSLQLPLNSSIIDQFKFRIGSYVVSNVFNENLKNIKREVEKR